MTRDPGSDASAAAAPAHAHARAGTHGAGPRRGVLWLALFAGQAAWLLDMEIGYLLVYAACASGRHLELTLTTAATLLAALAGFAVCWRAWRLASSAEADGDEQPDRFLALAGIGLNVMAILLIAGMAIPRAVLDPCR